MKPDPKTLVEAIQFFADAESCRQFLIERWWPNGIECPKCGNKDVLYMAAYSRWRCRAGHPSPQFTLKTGTIMEDSPIPLGKWLMAMWMLTNCKNGISSYEVHRAIGVSQKSTWFMLHRIREAMHTTPPASSMGSADGGEVEADETYVGPNPRKMHAARRLKLNQERSRYTNTDPDRPRGVGKTIVQGLLDRESRQVRAKVVRSAQRESLQTVILDQIARGSRLYTDEHAAYCSFDGRYIHEVVNHMEEYVNGRVHTNGLENFWSLFKRTLRGTYVAVEPFHLDRYADEQSFRFNNRATKGNPVNDADRFALIVSQATGKRLTYAKLTGKEGETAAAF